MSLSISSLSPSDVVETSAVKVAVLPMSGRLSLRARGDVGPLGAALGLELPQRIGARAVADTIEAVCLGPDEWTILLPVERVSKVQKAFASIYATLPHSVTEISAREVSFSIIGPDADKLLSIGCARDIASIAPGQARRTLFDGVTVVLWRDSEESFRMDVWNSFAPFLAQSLETGAKELAADALRATA